MGAPQQQQQQQKILRIGIIQGGRITEERLIRHGETVTIGDGQKNTFVLHSSGLPRRFPIFIFKGTQYTLAFTDEMDGKLSMDGGVVMGMDGIKSKSVKQKDGSYHFPLTDQIRGKVTIAGTTILFQFVPPPPVPAKSAMARDFQSSWIKQVDPIYWGMVALSSVLHATVMIYLMSLPVPKEPTLEDIPDQFAKFIVPPKAEVKVEAAPAEDKGKAEEATPKPKKEEKSEAKDNSNDQPKPEVDVAKRREVRKEELKKVGILGLLGTRGAGQTGRSIENVLSGGDSAPGLDAVLAANREGGIAVASGGSIGGLRSVKGSGPGDVDVKTVEAKANVETKKHVAMRPRIEASGPSDVTGSMDRGTLDTVITQNKASITACYERVLLTNPTFRGKIYIEFTVEATGRVSNVNIRNAGGQTDDQMEDCIKGKVSRWRFPKSEDGGPSDVSLPIVLTASQS